MHSRKRSLLGVALVSLPFILNAAPAAAQTCPPGASYRGSNYNRGFCLFSTNPLPPGPVTPACDDLANDRVGFSYPLTADTASYTCPAGSTQSFDWTTWQRTCTFDNLNVPQDGTAGHYCNYIESGYIGYAFDVCANGATYVYDGMGTTSCWFEDLEVPNTPTLTPYCTWANYGYIGFSWEESPATQNYTCPSSAYRTNNDQGLQFCIFSISASRPLQAHCDQLLDGTIGYSWSY